MENTPQHTLVVLVFIRQNDQILLVQQAYGKRYWSLPGGMVECGESLEEAAVRETFEETGLIICIKRVVGLYSKTSENALAITFEAKAVDGELHPNNEVCDVRYFPIDHLPENVRPHFMPRIMDYLQNMPFCVVRTQ